MILWTFLSLILKYPKPQPKSERLLTLNAILRMIEHDNELEVPHVQIVLLQTVSLWEYLHTKGREAYTCCISDAKQQTYAVMNGQKTKTIFWQN